MDNQTRGKSSSDGSSATDMEPGAAEETGNKFQTTFGLVMSCMGCVVGTGNIWRFPRIVASNSNTTGCLVFLMIWVLFLFLWSCPMLLIEYTLGRYSKQAVLGSFRHYLGDKYIWCGAWISMVSFFISCYYSVVLGWCLYYIVFYIGTELPTDEQTSTATFYAFAQESSWPVFTHFVSLAIATCIVYLGVKGIERACSVLIPTLLVIVLFTFIWSLTREYADLGIKYLFTPEWEMFKDPRTWVDAVSQNAFDTGAGMGLLVPYASYMTRRNGIVRYGHIIPTANNIVSLIVGMTIFITVFSTLTLTQPWITREQTVEILRESGPASTGLTFIWIPVLFSSLGVFGRVLAVLFFLSLGCAGLSSLLSNVELVAHTLCDFGVPRKYGMPLTFALIFLGGLASALNLDILANQDFVWGFALVINGFLFQTLVIKFGANKFRQICINEYSTDDWYLPKYWNWLVRIVAPLEAIVLIVWWAIDLITSDKPDGEKWYQFGRETLVMTLLQWIIIMALVVAANFVWLHFSSILNRLPYRQNATKVSGQDQPDEKTPLLSSQEILMLGKTPKDSEIKIT